MSDPPSKVLPSTVRRRVAALVLVALLAAGAATVGGAVGSNERGGAEAETPAPKPLEFAAGGKVVLSLGHSDGQSAIGRSQIRRILASRLSERDVVRRRGARITYRYDVEATMRRAGSRLARGGRVRVARVPVAAQIAAPIVRQAQRNTCESAALEMLLASAGRRVGQERLQAALPRSGPLDPVEGPSGRTWGDPDRGYVGRPGGGGTAGGFGVFPAPVAATAARYGRELDDLSGASPRRVYERLLRGKAVMAWIGLSDGPYGEWRSPQGKRIRVNFGEHTIVLVGLTAGGELRVLNPLDGTSETWSRARFEEAWELLARRALAVR